MAFDAYDVQKERDYSFDAKLKEQTKKAISDDIEILSNYSNVFILIPVRFFVPKQIELLHKMSSQMYLSIFKTPMKTLKEYFSTYASIDQVFNDIRPKLKQQIIFSEGDSTSETLEKKFERYISLNREISKDKDDISIFFLAVYGYIAQAIDVSLTTIQYNVVPYIRFTICHHYILLLASTFVLQLENGDKSSFEDKLMMMTAVHVFYNCFDLTKIDKVNFDDYVDIIRSLHFSSNYIKKIKNNFSSATTQKKYINQIAEEELQHIYSVLEKQVTTTLNP